MSLLRHLTSALPQQQASQATLLATGHLGLASRLLYPGYPFQDILARATLLLQESPIK